MAALSTDMASLYRESVANIVYDETVSFHALSLPNIDGESFVSSRGVDPELDRAVEKILGIHLQDMDCVVVLGANILEEYRNEEEMAEIAIEHIVQHINSMWEVGDPNMGWVNKPIGSALISSLLTCAHPVLSLVDNDGEMVTKVKDKAMTSIAQSRFHANTQTRMAIERICEEAAVTNGGYLAFPAKVSDIVSTSREMFCDVIDRMEIRPIGTV